MLDIHFRTTAPNQLEGKINEAAKHSDVPNGARLIATAQLRLAEHYLISNDRAKAKGALSKEFLRSVTENPNATNTLKLAAMKQLSEL